ncbi:hypothetical protein [Halomarina ordinaria]|uniref:Uncharacterized protein n=1 Tax=Halomarina ordinaria TaxID=3033939 RepID=A0ABD5UAK6_9EURY|nr:hypothetical protein [Halomarina sp. PSRA2]
MTKGDRRKQRFETGSGVEYSPHSMMHKAIVRMDPTKLEMLNGFERTDNGHKYAPPDSNVRVIISGRDWSNKRLFVYGCLSSEEAAEYIEKIINRVCEIGHEATLLERPEIMNIAVSGDLGTPLQLEEIPLGDNDPGLTVEYEPEQFPAAIVRLDDFSATFMLYSTGRFVIQGLRRTEDIEPAINRIQTFLKTTVP